MSYKLDGRQLGPMPSESEQVVMAWFFAQRSARKKGPPDEAQLRLNRAVWRRARAQELERQAARHFYELALEH